MQDMHWVLASLHQKQKHLFEVWISQGLEGVDKPWHWLLLLSCWYDGSTEENRNSLQCANLESACPVAQCDEILVAVFGELPDISDKNSSSSEDNEDDYMKKDWHAWEEMVPCRTRKVKYNPLVDRDKIFLPPLHIKHGLIKYFAKALDKHLTCAMLFQDSSWRSWQPSLHQLIRKPKFENLMKWNWKHEWVLFWSWRAFLATTRLGASQNF